MGTELEKRVEALERRVRAAEDVDAIQRLKARYGQLVDLRYDRKGPKGADELEKLATQIADLFSEDAVWDGGAGLGECRGREAIRRRFLAPTLRFSWHFFVKPHIEVDGDRAHGTWDILAPCTATDGTPMWMAGVEDDRYVREGGRWLHESMKLRVVFMAPHAKGWSKADQSKEG
ncbi:MAG TPA: nuclear transport factor 2 family protein [Myxococcota bacterium]|nr:nuclear transport factor 2 family protein [Myxococcota bacterium]